MFATILYRSIYYVKIFRGGWPLGEKQRNRGTGGENCKREGKKEKIVLTTV